MNPTDVTAICLRRTTKKEETDREIEATTAKGAGMTVGSTTVGDLDLHSDLDLPMPDAADPGLPTMAIATCRAHVMDRNMDEDETADLGARLPLPRPSDRARHRAAAPDLQPRAEEDTRRDVRTSNASDRDPDPDHARRDVMQIDLADVEIALDHLLRRGCADKIRKVDLVAEVDLHLHHLRPVVLEAIPHRAAGA